MQTSTIFIFSVWSLYISEFVILFIQSFSRLSLSLTHAHTFEHFILEVCTSRSIHVVVRCVYKMFLILFFIQSTLIPWRRRVEYRMSCASASIFCLLPSNVCGTTIPCIYNIIHTYSTYCNIIIYFFPGWDVTMMMPVYKKTKTMMMEEEEEDGGRSNV